MYSSNHIATIVLLLKQKYPSIETQLNYNSAYELLISTILSAQCTDKRVNEVTKVLFKKYPDAKALADADIEEVKKIIHSVGFFNNKAKNIINCSKKIVNDFNSNLPDKMQDLITLPGVGRKTANVLLSNWFKKSEGIAVDTHVGRISQRLGLSTSSDVRQIEKDLMKKIPKNEWNGSNLRLVQFGRDVCKSRKPDCANCPLNKICPSAFRY